MTNPAEHKDYNPQSIHENFFAEYKRPLTLGNCQEVATNIEKYLSGKPFVVVIADEKDDFKPEVIPSEYLSPKPNEAIRVMNYPEGASPDDYNHAILKITTNNNIWFIVQTSAKTESVDFYDPSFKTPNIAITKNQVRIECIAPDMKKRYIVLAIQPDRSNGE